jgi:putative phosphoserine phosphatase / 1-acylglycerol-3-phosphate O-acyltransferase
MIAPQQNIGAFFDLDGTLLPAPSLEWRFIRYLLERDEISTAHAARWLAHFVKTILRNPDDAIKGNKLYLAGINESLANDWERTLAPASAHEDSLPLFAHGLQRIAWHHTRGHQIFLITGTLAPLAQIAATRITAQIQAPIEVRATQLEVQPQGWHSHSWLCSSTQWTGRPASKHMSKKAKADALEAVAATHNINLAQSYAYGDTGSDLPMLESVGHPQTVNPKTRLAQIAKKRSWPILNWDKSGTAPIPSPATSQNFGSHAVRQVLAHTPHSSTHSKKAAEI